jgi:hypothetical protein
VAVVASLLVAGSPSQARLQRYDQQRVADLQTIDSAVVTYASRQYRLSGEAGLPTGGALLPENLAALRQMPGYGELFLADPITEQPYGYRAVDGVTYELCATFQAASVEQLADSPQAPTWTHGSGPTCFTRSIDPVQFGVEGTDYRTAAPKPLPLD